MSNPRPCKICGNPEEHHDFDEIYRPVQREEPLRAVRERDVQVRGRDPFPWKMFDNALSDMVVLRMKLAEERRIADDLAKALRAAHPYTPTWTDPWWAARDAVGSYEEARKRDAGGL